MLMRKLTGLSVVGVSSALVLVAACGSSDDTRSVGRCDADAGADDGTSGSSGSGNAGNSGGSDGQGDGGEGASSSGGADDGAGGGEGELPAGAVPALPGGFTASNLPDDLELEVGEDMIFNGETCASEARINTDEGTIVCYSPGEVQRHPSYVFAVAKQADGSEVAVFAGKNIVLEPTVRIVVEGQRPLVLLAPGNVQLSGTLQAIPNHIYAEEGNGGGFSSTDGEQVKGQGPGGGGGTTVNAGGGAYCGAGGPGGGAQSSLGGVAYGSEELVPLLGGSSGGNGGTGGVGGAGGGAVHVIAGGKLTLTATGVIHVGGSGGGWNGGGGGSGGAILLEGSELHIAGTLAANGGGGGEGSVSGDDGLYASPDAVPAPGGITGTDTTDDDGGSGSAADGIDGSSGGSVRGGGGGGAGRIRLNSKSGEADISGVLSPGATTECVTQGTLGG